MRFPLYSIPVLFFLTLFVLVFGNGWYESSRLIIKGIVPEDDAQVVVRFDSGSGFNKYETERFPINTVSDEDGIQTITVRALGEKHRKSESSAIELSAIYLDGKKFELASVEPRSILRDRLAIHLTKKDQVYQVKAKAAKHIKLEFSRSFYFGKAEIRVNGNSSVYDFFTPKKRLDTVALEYWIKDSDGNFAVSMDLPRYRVRNLEISGNENGRPALIESIVLESGDLIKDLSGSMAPDKKKASCSNVNEDLKRYLHPSHLLLQTIFAALITWMLVSGFLFVRKRGGLKNAILAEKRYVFWLFFIGAAGVYCLWLTAFWPGVMSIDSLKIWRAAGLPGVFINDHPVLNMVFYMFLMHLWNNVAVVPVAQVFLSALLIAYTFFWLYRCGVSLKLIVPCFLLVVFSIPVGLYNTVLWKDIPYALLVVFWGVTLVRFFCEKREGRLSFSRQEIASLFLLYIALGLIRHNGLFYLAVIPLYFMLLVNPPGKRVVIALLVACVVAGGAFFHIMNDPPRFIKKQFLYRISHGYVEKLKKVPLDEKLSRAGVGYCEIFDMEKEGTKSDRFHYYLYDRYAYNFLRLVGFNDFYPYIDPKPRFPLMRKAAMDIYEKTYQKPWKYVVWNPFFMLAIVPLSILGLRWFPNAAIFGSFVFVGAASLIVLDIYNWRYYYFYYFALYFVLPIVFLDLRLLCKKKSVC